MKGTKHFICCLVIVSYSFRFVLFAILALSGPLSSPALPFEEGTNSLSADIAFSGVRDARSEIQ